MEGLSKPCLARLSRRAGVKSLSDDSHETIRNLIAIKLTEIIKNIMIINDNNNTKTIMVQDVYKALELTGIKIAESNCLNISKKNIF